MDWLKLGGVGVLAVVLSLIGFGIASRIEEPSVFAAPPTSQATNQAPSTTIATGLTSTTSSGAATTAPASGSASLSLSTAELDFGEDGQTSELEISNSGQASAAWSIEGEHPGVSVSPAAGDLGEGESQVVTVTLDRAQIEEGEFEATLRLTWENGEADVRVLALYEDNPIIHNPTASPASVAMNGSEACSPTRTTISARVRDTSELDQVIARWSPDGTEVRETAMEPVGEDIFEGLIGPYELARTDEVRVLAFDVRGNAGGAAVPVTVVPCP